MKNLNGKYNDPAIAPVHVSRSFQKVLSLLYRQERLYQASVTMDELQLEVDTFSTQLKSLLDAVHNF